MMSIVMPLGMSAAMRMKGRIAEGQLRRWVEVWREIFELEEEAVEGIAQTIDRAINEVVSTDLETVFEWLVEVEEWYPMGFSYILTYARLIYLGYPAKFDIEYFAGLPSPPDGIMKGKRL